MTEVNLYPSDINDAVKIIDYAAEQGAFRGWENIRQIIVVRDRLSAFAESIRPAETTETTEPGEPEAV